MASITIRDTGYLTADRNGTANSGTRSTGNSTPSNFTTYLCNGGSAITIKCTGMRLRSGTNLADEPNPSSGDVAASHFVTFENRLIEFDFIIDVQSSTDRALLQEISLLERTSGIKVIYISDTSTTVKTLVEILGYTDSNFHGNEITSGLPAFIGRVKGTTINNISTSRRAAISGTITFEEERL